MVICELRKLLHEGLGGSLSFQSSGGIFKGVLDPLCLMIWKDLGMSDMNGRVGNMDRAADMNGGGGGNYGLGWG